MNNLITMRGVAKDYRRGSETIHALRDVTMSIATGEFVAVLGPSGSGKSTLLQILGCLDRPDAGEIEFDGEAMHAASERALTAIRSRKVGFVFQQFFLQPTLTALENVQVPAIFASSRPEENRAKELLDEVGLNHRLHHRPSELSGGEMQRVAIARALINEPKLLLADEPTGSLDSSNAQAVVELFARLHAHGLTVVMVTHNDQLARHAARTLQMQDGTLRET